MSDAPTSWELQRQIEQLRRDLSAIGQGTVSAQLFAAEQRRVDERHAELAREGRETAEDLAQLRAEVGKERDERKASVRWLLASIALPVAALLVTVYLGLAR